MKRFFPLLVFLLIATPALARPEILSLTVDHGKPLTLRAAASSVFVANPDIADVQVMSPTQVMLFGKRTGETSFLATDDKGAILAQRTVVVTQDLSGLREELAAAIPGNAIKAKPVPNGIVLTGTARDATSVADAYKIAMRYMPSGGDIINRIQVTGSNQIQIRVRFAEVQRNIDNSLGFDWQNILTVGSGMTIGLATGSTVNSGLTVGTTGSSSSGLFPRPNNTTLSTPNNVLGVALHSGHLTVDGMIDALAQDGLLTMLAEPTLTAMSGETANFLAGGEFPIPIPQGNGTISITFKDYGISLAFTPTLLSGNRISLHVRPEVSELTDTGSIVMDNITVPALTTRKAETTVEVASGESFAIAGLMDNSQAQTVNKFPLLGDMPVLGALFRDDHFQNGQTELVVIITPYIVKPSGEKLALPTDGYAPPTENERLAGMRYSSGDPNARPMSGDPVAVPAAPAAAPVMPVSSASNAVKTPALQTPVASAPAAAAAPPLVLHPASDTDKRSGGLLVE
ncbi:MAG: type II and III secretion system protein family protein [Alphaproteobacteria bacterium]|nr:type II and III secretion system protein family protein [Alphaproteobacteria bacterium]